MFRRHSSAIAIAAIGLAARRSGARRQPAGRVRHHRGQDPDRALSRRRAEDGRELPRLREGQALRRHAVPPRDPGLHDPGRRIHRRLQAEADPAADPERGRAKQQGGLAQRPGHDRDGAHGRPELGDRAVLHQRQRQQVRSTSAKPTPQGYGYTVFGKVVEGMDVVDKIATTPTGTRRPVPEGRAGRARDHQERDRRRRQIGADHGHPAHQPRRDHARARRRERAEDGRQLPRTTSAPAITTTRSSIA